MSECVFVIDRFSEAPHVLHSRRDSSLTYQPTISTLIHSNCKSSPLTDMHVSDYSGRRSYVLVTSISSSQSDCGSIYVTWTRLPDEYNNNYYIFIRFMPFSWFWMIYSCKLKLHSNKHFIVLVLFVEATRVRVYFIFPQLSANSRAHHCCRCQGPRASLAAGLKSLWR